MSSSIDYTAPLDATTLVVEVASGAFAFRNKIKAASIKTLWEKLSAFIVDTLRHQKGVLLPNLGNFRVGPVVGETKKKIRPLFTLLEGRYGSVSQERAKYIVGGRTPIIQPNYGLLSTLSGIHRGATQRLVAELLQRLGVHIMSGRPVKTEFPGLGKMVTNRAGRFEFVFDSLFMEYFEREHYGLIKEMEYDPQDQQVLKGLQHVHLEDPPYIKSAASSRPVSAVGAASKHPQLKEGAHAPYKGGILQLYKLCVSGDRINSGTVPRLQLEQWLHKEVRSLLTMVDGATVLDLLSMHTFGKTSKYILYRPFLDGLERVIGTFTPWGGSPRSPRAQPQPSYADHSPAEQPRGEGLQEEASVRDLVQPEDQRPYAVQAGAPQVPMAPHPQQGYYYPQYPPASAQAPPPLQIPSPVISEPQPSDYLHYNQNQLSPRSRADYDDFNRAHFERLYSARGPRPKGVVTPKVGEEPLNEQEYRAVRQSPSRSRPVSAIPSRLPPGYSAAPANAPQSLLQNFVHEPPPRMYNSKAEILTLLRDPSPNNRPSPPRPRPSSAVPSQYDIIREDDPVTKGRLKAELARQLQQGWQQQIQEKERLESALETAQRQWPFAPTNVPNDKRPVSAISRPLSSPRAFAHSPWK